MGNEVLAKLRSTADKVRVQRADRPAAAHTLNEGLDVYWGNGTRTGLRYSQFLWTRLFSPESLTINFSTHSVVVKGERLASVYELVLSQRLRTLRESEKGEIEDAEKKGAPVIKTLFVAPKAGNLVEVEPEGGPPVAALPSPAPEAVVESKDVCPLSPEAVQETESADEQAVLPLLDLLAMANEGQEESEAGDRPDDDVSDLSKL